MNAEKVKSGLCGSLLVLSALTGLLTLVSVTASAATLELGRCSKLSGEKVGKKTVYHGAYANHICTKSSPTGTGKYEWAPGPGPDRKFVGSSSQASFIEGDGSPEPVTQCGTTSYSGEYTGPTTFTENIVFSGCSHAQETCVEALEGREPECPQPCNNNPEQCEVEEFHPCSSAGAGEGEIRSAVLEGRFGLISGPKRAKKRVAVLLTPAAGLFAGFECDGEGVGWAGSLLGLFRTTEKMSTAFAASFSQRNASAFEGESGGGFSARPAMGGMLTNEEPLEVRVLE